eukprot:scaffold757_cov76-Skeletonema_dohrnii-CCMP3373.AAC.1
MSGILCIALNNVESATLCTIITLVLSWQFVFEKSSNRKLRVVKPYDISEYGATTLVRIHSKLTNLAFPSPEISIQQMTLLLSRRN